MTNTFHLPPATITAELEHLVQAVIGQHGWHAPTTEHALLNLLSWALSQFGTTNFLGAAPLPLEMCLDLLKRAAAGEQLPQGTWLQILATIEPGHLLADHMDGTAWRGYVSGRHALRHQHDNLKEVCVPLVAKLRAAGMGDDADKLQAALEARKG